LSAEEASIDESHEQESKVVTGRWSKGEHQKFIKGKSPILKCTTFYRIALSLFGRDWKKVEVYIGTRSGAQIRSHAQKFFTRIEKEYAGDVDSYINKKAKEIEDRSQNEQEIDGDESNQQDMDLTS
jgi:SHAQKYF class myb-like DNA-binding protein